MTVNMHNLLLIATLGLASVAAAQTTAAGQAAAAPLPPPLAPEVSDVATLPPTRRTRFSPAGFGREFRHLRCGYRQVGRQHSGRLRPQPGDRSRQQPVLRRGNLLGARLPRPAAGPGVDLGCEDAEACQGNHVYRAAPWCGKIQNFHLSASGSRAYVYIMRPASSVVWVDLKKQAVGGTVEVPGCALVFPWGD